MCVSGGKTKFLGGQFFLFFIFIFLLSIFSPECGIAQLSLSLFVSLSLGFSPMCGIAQFSLSLFVSLSCSTSMTSIIFLFELVHINDLFCDIVEEVKIKRVLKPSIQGGF